MLIKHQQPHLIIATTTVEFVEKIYCVLDIDVESCENTILNSYSKWQFTATY